MIKPKSYAAWYEGLGYTEIAEFLIEDIDDTACVDFTCWVRDNKPEVFVHWASMQKWYQDAMHKAYEAAFPDPEED